ncbi:MAG TPA: DUF5709 domain-containing protein [Streptosporangiales bacterium]
MTISDDGSFEEQTLPPEESLDDDETGVDPEEGYSPPERPRGVTAWGVTAEEEEEPEDLDRRLAQEEQDDDTDDGDGIGDTDDTDGEPIDDQVGDARSGRLVLEDVDEFDSRDLWARDVGVDGAGASAEEAAVHVVPDEDDS